jgi:TetR/AcrR family transcriptional regulator, cholesterol catabolism regulator
VTDPVSRLEAGDLRPRQRLTKRQASTVTALLDAGLEYLRDHGYSELTLRAVAARAGVTHTTAYNYFTSKAHLVAEIFWRQLQAVPGPISDPTAPLGDRVTEALRGPGLLLAGEPALADAALSALLLQDPDIRRLRNAIGADLAFRIQTALGADADPQVVEAVLLAFSGAMLQAGMGYFTFPGVIERIGGLAALLERAP